jgi:hypothetical protein
LQLCEYKERREGNGIKDTLVLKNHSHLHKSMEKQ